MKKIKFTPTNKMPYVDSANGNIAFNGLVPKSLSKDDQYEEMQKDGTLKNFVITDVIEQKHKNDNPKIKGLTIVVSQSV